MKRYLSPGASGAPGARVDEAKPDPANAEDRRQSRGRLRGFLEWRSRGVRFALSRAKRRARESGPIKCIAALSSNDENRGAPTTAC